jgi:hypothetical protein
VGPGMFSFSFWLRVIGRGEERGNEADKYSVVESDTRARQFARRRIRVLRVRSGGRSVNKAPQSFFQISQLELDHFCASSWSWVSMAQCKICGFRFLCYYALISFCIYILQLREDRELKRRVR